MKTNKALLLLTSLLLVGCNSSSTDESEPLTVDETTAESQTTIDSTTDTTIVDSSSENTSSEDTTVINPNQTITINFDLDLFNDANFTTVTDGAELHKNDAFKNLFNTSYTSLTSINNIYMTDYTKSSMPEGYKFDQKWARVGTGSASGNITLTTLGAIKSVKVTTENYWNAYEVTWGDNPGVNYTVDAADITFNDDAFNLGYDSSLAKETVISYSKTKEDNLKSIAIGSDYYSGEDEVLSTKPRYLIKSISLEIFTN